MYVGHSILSWTSFFKVRHSYPTHFNVSREYTEAFLTGPGGCQHQRWIRKTQCDRLEPPSLYLVQTPQGPLRCCPAALLVLCHPRQAMRVPTPVQTGNLFTSVRVGILAA